jgi:predicted Zn-dependent protease
MYNRRAGFGGVTLLIALVMTGCSLMQYFSSTQVNPTTGEKQHVSLTPKDEIALGLKATPEMEQQYGGLSQNERASTLVDHVGQRIVAHSDAGKSPYAYNFHLLADPQTINAFALPGGQVFITEGLLKRLHTEGEVAGVLGHEVGHVIGRHSAEQLAKQQLTQGLVGAAGVAATDPSNPYSGQQAQQIAAMVGQMVSMKYSRGDESKADHFGVQLMSQAGYDPRAMLGVMKVLSQASAGGHTPEFFSTHPNPDNRAGLIQQEIKQLYPNGVPGGLQP